MLRSQKHLELRIISNETDVKMKAIIFFIEDNKEVKLPESGEIEKINEFTEVPVTQGSLDLFHFKRYFKSVEINFNKRTDSRKVEALNILYGDNINLNTEVIKERFDWK